MKHLYNKPSKQRLIALLPKGHVMPVHANCIGTSMSVFEGDNKMNKRSG